MTNQQLLPTGIPAIVVAMFAFGPVVPGMDQVWYVCPITKKTGGIGSEIAFAASAIFYTVFRWIKIKWRRRL